MKRKLKKVFTPQRTFERWAAQNNVILEKAQQNEKRQVFSRRPRQRKILAGLYSVLAVCLIVAVLLPVVLLSSDMGNSQLRTYTAQDSVQERIDLGDLYRKNNILLFDAEQLIEFGLVLSYSANDNEELILGYRIEKCLIAASDGENAFYVDYRIRTYKNYEFVGHTNYNGLSNNFSVNNTEIFYTIIESGMGNNAAYLSFVYESLEYFLDVGGFPEVTEITEDTLKILLGDLLK